ncbi:MAG TPA: response regulator transcription factor [Phycisphaerae bacterium]|nr:response regulator transcription factor [Phycisphaerae bacterium]
MAADARPRVLIVEDEPDMNNLLADILSVYDFEPLRAATGKQALALLDQQNPDAILLDLMLPDFSGIELCKRLKDSRDTRRIPIVILTALDGQVHRRKAYEAGADDYMTKPFAPEALVARLRACLDQALSTPERCRRLDVTIEPTASISDLKAFNALVTCLRGRTDLDLDRVEALRKGLVRIADAAGQWAAAHDRVPPVRLTINLESQMLRLTFEPQAAGGDAFLAEHLADEAAVPAALIDAGVIDRVRQVDSGVVFEKALAPPES